MPMSSTAPSRASVSPTLQQIFPGNSEMACRMRAFDWLATPLGSPHGWPRHLRTALGICLSSRFAMQIWWGRDLTLFYNDAYISFLGPSKHPFVLGRSGREAWSEIWQTIGPMIERVLTTSEASWSEDILMFFDRNVRSEEVYATFSFSPVFGERGQVDGLFCACSETTEKLIGNRRLETLRLLGIRASEARTVEDACRTSVDVLGKNPQDIPFAGIYLVDASGANVELSHATADAGEVLPRVVSLKDERGRRSPLSAVAHSRLVEPISDLSSIGDIGRNSGEDVPAAALVLPIEGTTRDELVGLLVVGVSPCRMLDAAYRSFFDLIAGHIGTALADARAYHSAQQRASELTELDRAKTTFFSNVSHEFRTPLALILGQLDELLQRRGPDGGPEVGGGLEAVHRNALRLLKLVNTLLDFSRIEAGRMQARFEPTDLALATTELASVFRSTIERAGLSSRRALRSAVVAGLRRSRHVGEDRAQPALQRVQVHVRRVRSTVRLRQTDGGAELAVRDTGVGIAPADQLLGSSSGSTASRACARVRTKARASALRWCRSW